eukprot:CAMPEP_0179151332 /NCGR_PEP_ID=MMETSP0796-20121207/73463_1 /TAXON_ID=73915 /ORGANISM="Pyrodinium bahamense, Strain pbaha01" /LENGTH=221 /DNA_ID=CAMNT_0020852415 /DNA_START=33 /DNA_END=698 /DNA_ORIENTATION=+
MSARASHLWREQIEGRLHDRASLPAEADGSAGEALRAAGFRPCPEGLDTRGESGGCTEPGDFVEPGERPSPGALIRLMELRTADTGANSSVGFVCRQELAKQVFYAQMTVAGRESEQCMKGAITTLLDVAEACGARRITLGLRQEQTCDSQLICSLLYLGFEVAPSRRSPLACGALQLNFDFGTPLPGKARAACASDASTAAVEDFHSQRDLESTDGEQGV